MQRKELLEIAKLTRELYNRQDFLKEQETFDAWYEALQDIPYQRCREALMRHVKSNRYLPTIADLRDAGRKKYDFTFNG